MNNELKPCPFCGSVKVRVKLREDCYSSWATCTCECGAYVTVGTDAVKSCPCPCPREDWKEFALKFWNDDDYAISKTITVLRKRNRGQRNEQ